MVRCTAWVLGLRRPGIEQPVLLFVSWVTEKTVSTYKPDVLIYKNDVSLREPS